MSQISVANIDSDRINWGSALGSGLGLGLGIALVPWLTYRRLGGRRA